MFIVQQSEIHGHGAYATELIKEGTVISEYTGNIVPPEQANSVLSSIEDEPDHTFSFMREDGSVIDAANGGNDSRFINHSCDPNCESFEDDDGHVWIRAIRDIDIGEELSFDYALCIDEVYTDELKSHYICHCGSSKCRGTLLNLDYVPDLFGQRLFQEQIVEMMAKAQEQIEVANNKLDTLLSKLSNIDEAD